MPGKRGVKAKKAPTKAAVKRKAPKPELNDYQEGGWEESQLGRRIPSLAQLWREYPPEVWYGRGAGYWETVSADEHGMLGGLTELKGPDERESVALLERLRAKIADPEWGQGRCCDCGGGIGRVTREVLMQFFVHVDLVEQCPAFVETGAKACNELRPGSVTPMCVGLQDFDPPANHYQLVWVQWVTGHLRDDHFVRFLERCAASLTNNGIIVIKDNASSVDGFVVDVKDHSVSRTLAHVRHLVAVAGLKLMLVLRQTGFPPNMLPVYMWVIGRADCRVVF